MSWIKDIEIWNTLFELKEDHPNLGFKGDKFFAYDFPQELSTGKIKTCIANPTFTGLELGKGICSFLVTDEELEKYFTPIDKTFKQLENEKISKTIDPHKKNVEMLLTKNNQEYEKIMQSQLTDRQRNMKLAELMTQMESEFSIPMLSNPEWEKNNKKVITLYRKISMSRKFD